MFTADELEGVPVPLVNTVNDMQKRIMEDVVRRIKITGDITRSADWQIKRLSELGMAREEIRKNIQELLKYSDEQIDELYGRILAEGYARDTELYKAAGVARKSFNKNKDLQKLIAATKEQTKGQFRNITQSMGFAEKINGKMQFTKLADFYQRELDSAVMEMLSGSSSYDEVLKRVVNEMATSGLRSVDYASGRSYRIENATRTALMTGFSQTLAKMNDSVADELGIETFEVSWHGGARPSHQVWQGRVYDRKGLEEVCGLGSATGLLGINCYHSYNPFYPGISKRNYTDAWLDKMIKEENTPKEYHGEEYTKYEALQMQRKLERTMRVVRDEVNLLTLGGGSDEDITELKIKYTVLMDRYAQFSDAMGLPQQTARITVRKMKKK